MTYYIQFTHGIYICMKLTAYLGFFSISFEKFESRRKIQSELLLIVCIASCLYNLSVCLPSIFETQKIFKFQKFSFPRDTYRYIPRYEDKVQNHLFQVQEKFYDVYINIDYNCVYQFSGNFCRALVRLPGSSKTSIYNQSHVNKIK